MSADRELMGQRHPLARDSILAQIGNTPLLRFANIGKEFDRVEIYGKAEWFNPGGSVKDRPAGNMVREGLKSGALRPGKILLDATSGNTGIAYAMIGASQGFPVKLCVPSNVTAGACSAFPVEMSNGTGFRTAPAAELRIASTSAACL